MITMLSASKKIPTIFGILGVLVSVLIVAVTSQKLGEVTKTFSQADSPPTPSFVEAANITDNSATIFWITDKETTGSVFYGKTSKLGDGAESDSSKNITHMVPITNLKPSTKYYFKIGDGADLHEFTTGPSLQSSQTVEPIFGKVLDSSGAPVSGVIVTWQVSGAEKIATLTKGDGSYVLPIGNARASGLASFFPITDGLSETITFQFELDNSTTTISCKTGQDRPLPTIRLGETIDCTKRTSSPNPSTGFKAPTADAVSINFEDGQTFQTGLPTISGKAGPNQIVQIVVNSETPYSGTVQADPSGNWSWTPPANLTPGQHTVTITVVGLDGKSTTVTRTFTVSSGSPILPITSGTPSAQLTHFACVGSTCSTVAGVGPNTCSADADCVVAPVPPPPSPPPPPKPPATGSLENTLILLTFGLFFATLGGITFFKTNGSK